MKTRTNKSDLLMLVAAFIWGSTFVAQRLGMRYAGPFTFNGFRFLIGAAVVYTLSALFVKNGIVIRSDTVLRGILMGFALFFAITFQQWGLVYTTAGKGGFITGLYVVFVPILGLLIGKKSKKGHFYGAFLSLMGMYFLSVKSGFVMEKGDLMVFVGALFWTLHVHLIDSFVNESDPMSLAFYQFITTAFLSIIIAFFYETPAFILKRGAVLSVLYAGVLSSGIAYTLQVIAQKYTHHSHAAIILSLESVFAAISGWIILHETFTLREFSGVMLMLSGMLVSGYFTGRMARQDI